MLNKQKLIDALEDLWDVIDHQEHDPMQANGVNRAIALVDGFPDDNPWIPIGESLPEENQKVWVTNEYHGGSRRVEESVYKNNEFYETGYLNRDIVSTDLVKAWCPRFVPEPYKEVSEE